MSSIVRSFCLQFGKDGRGVVITFAFLLATFLISAVCASIHVRGLYQDGAYYLLKIAERDWFYLVDPARTTVQTLRQLPVVLLSRFSDASLFERAQAFTFAMLVLPPTMVWICFALAPRGMKGWILLPALHLLLGLSTTSIEAVGEASIAAAYIWILIFLLIFRTRSITSQILFLLLTLPAFQLHEGIVLCAPILILICVLRAIESSQWRVRAFVGVATCLFVAGAIYELSWIVHPRLPGNMANAWQAVFGFQFLVFEGRWNLPVVSGALAIGTLASVFSIFIFRPAEVAQKEALRIALAFFAACLLLVLVAATTDRSFGPRAQAQARYNPIFVTLLLAGFLIGARRNGRAYGILTSGPILLIVLSLGSTQFLIDLIATQRWAVYVADFDARLRKSTGLIPWDETVRSSSSAAGDDWKMITIDWTLPIMCIILARDGRVAAIFDYPPWAEFRPLNPHNLDQLPSLRGVNYDAYRRALEQGKN
jgi:hypothetical protein